MKVTISAETETSIGNKSKATIFRWGMSLEQLQRLNDAANEIVAEGEDK